MTVIFMDRLIFYLFFNVPGDDFANVGQYNNEDDDEPKEMNGKWEKTLLSSPRNKVFITRQIQNREKGKTSSSLHCQKFSSLARGSTMNRERKAPSYPYPYSYQLAGNSFPIRQIQRRKGKKYRYIKRKEIQLYQD